MQEVPSYGSCRVCGTWWCMLVEFSRAELVESSKRGGGSRTGGAETGRGAGVV